MTARNYYGKGTYTVTSPSGKNFTSGVGRYWRQSYDNFLRMHESNEIWWGRDGSNMPAQKRFLADVQDGRVPQTLWKYTDVGHTQEAKKELLENVSFAENSNVLNSVKPTRLIERMLQIGTHPQTNDVIVDFLAGSGTTGHAVLKQNADDGGNRRYLCVQLPEVLPEPEPNLRTLADITRTRLRRAGTQIREQAAKDGRDVSGLDTGFQAYSLAESNFRQWQGDTTSAQFRDGQLGMLENMERQLRLFKDNVREDRSPRAILSELILAAGFELTTRVERIAVASQHAYSIADGALLICLERRIEAATITAMAERDPAQIICLDASFANDDQLRVNAAQTIRARARQHDRTIAFKVV